MRIRLGDVVDIIAGQHIESALYHDRPPGTPYLTGPADFGDTAPIVTKWTSAPKVFARSSDVLVTVKGAGVGKSNLGSDAAIGRQLMALRPRQGKVLQNYLFHFVRSQEREIARSADGATVPGIGKEDLATLDMPGHSIWEQRRIAAILDEAEALRRRRKRAIKLLDSLTQSIFMEMFGDPVSNPKSLPTKRLSDVASFVSGGTPSKKEDDYWAGPIPWVSPKDMKVNQIFDAEDHVGERALRETTLKLVEPSSILIVVRGMILAHTAPMAITRRPVTINQDMKAIRFNDTVEPDFGFWCLKAQAGHVLSKVSSAAHGTKRLETADIGRITVLMPQKHDQKRFIDAANTVCRTLGRLTSAFGHTASLFSSLQHRAFSSQL